MYAASENVVRLGSIPSSIRHGAAHRTLGMKAVPMLQNAEGRSPPARVYPLSDASGAWIVEPPVNDAAGSKTFTGRKALLDALEYAHRTYGSATYLSR